MPYKLAIFDFDGTLADTYPWFVQHLGSASRRFNFRAIQPEEVALLRNLSARQVMQHVQLPLWKIPFVASFMKRLMACDTENMRLFSGAKEVLRELSQGQGLTLALVSSNSEPNVRAILGREAGELISVYECGAALFGKARHFRRVLRRTGLSASEAVYVGDEIRDYDAATAVRIDFGAVTWGYTNGEALRALSPRFVFGHMGEIVGNISAAAELLP